VVGGGRGVSWSRGVRLGLGVDSGSLVSHISNVSVISVGRVLDVLDSAIGKSNGVSTLDIAGTIGGLLGVEVGLGVVISHGVGEGVGGNLIRVSLSLVSGGWGIGGGGLDNNGGVDSVSHNWGSVDSVGHNWGGVDSVGYGVDGVVGNWVDGVVGNWVDGVVGNGMDGVVGDGGNGVERDHSVLAYWDWLVGSNGGLDLRQTLGVVHLAH